MSLTFTETPLYYKDSQGQYQRILSGADMTAYRTAAAQDVIDAGKETAGLGLTFAAVGDLVRVASVDGNGKPTSWNHVPLCNITTNQNLLDNWYFVGSGSQDGDGKFPINSRGQSTYPNPGNCIDRWTNSGEFYIAQNWITMQANTSITQKLNDDLKFRLSGKTITLSIVCLNNTQLLSGTVIYNSIPESAITIASDSYFTILINANGDIELKSNNRYANCQAIKLELGSEQTLAHQENGQWVLNEIPDWNIERYKCDPTIGSNLATVEYSNTASKLYNPGEYLVYNGQLYKVGSTAISQGQTLTPDGNIRSTNITDNISNRFITGKFGGTVTVEADGFVETVTSSVITIPTGYKVAIATIGLYGAGADHAIPWFSGGSYSHFTIHNYKSTAVTLYYYIYVIFEATN